MRTMPILPALPSLRNFMPETWCGPIRRCRPTCNDVAGARAAFSMARLSWIVCPVGFSTKTWRPALSGRNGMSARASGPAWR